MKQLSDYTASTHEHRHVCPFCDEQLKLENDSERPKFTCSNTNCRLITCYCNGTIKESTVNRDTLFTYIKEEYNRSPENVIQNIRDDSITDPFATKIIERKQGQVVNVDDGEAQLMDLDTYQTFTIRSNDQDLNPDEEVEYLSYEGQRKFV